MKNRTSDLLAFIGQSARCVSFSVLLASAVFVTLPSHVYAQEDDPLAGADDSSLDDADLGDDMSEDEAPGKTADSKAPSDSKLDSMPALDLDNPEKDPFDFEEDEGLDEFQKTSEQLEDDFRKGAFQAALNKIMPLRPDEIRTLLERLDRTVESTETPVHPFPRPESVVQNVSLDPGSAPLTIKVAFGYVTTVSMVDSSGAPWPIEDITWVGNFAVQGESSGKDTPTNIMRVSPQNDFGHGNMSVKMLGLDTPIIFTLETNRDVVYYRFDAAIPGNGPFATAPLMQPGITLAAGDVDMSAALSGVLPKDAVKLHVEGTDGRTSAFKYNNYTYVRTPLTLLSPGWESSVSSADGTRVYALTDAPVLLLSDKGRMVRAYLSEREELLDE
ncbi:MAG: type IV secretion protein DotH [Alphaproteobacteria bacterium]|nr:type IV secretion protein DotH [Alphaproteobacteria bacterium]